MRAHTVLELLLAMGVVGLLVEITGGQAWLIVAVGAAAVIRLLARGL